MNSKENGMQRLYSAQRDSRVDKLPRIRMSPSGKRYGIQVRTATTKMRVPAHKISFICQTGEKKTLSCDLFFYITGKAMVVKSMKWKLLDKGSKEYGETPADADACDLIVRTLREIATRHKVSSIYANMEDVKPILLMRLGFTATDAHDYLHLDISKPEQKH